MADACPKVGLDTIVHDITSSGSLSDMAADLVISGIPYDDMSEVAYALVQDEPQLGYQVARLSDLPFRSRANCIFYMSRSEADSMDKALIADKLRILRSKMNQPQPSPKFVLITDAPDPVLDGYFRDVDIRAAFMNVAAVFMHYDGSALVESGRNGFSSV